MRAMHRTDTGFSIVELVVAMFLLAVLALALLPLLVGATRTSVVNKSLTSSTAFANAQLAPIKAAYPNDSTTSSCAALTTAYNNKTTVDPSGSGLQATISVGTCPSAPFPATVTVTVTVVKTASPSTILTSLPTKLLVAGS